MKIITSIHNYMRDALNKKSGVDGRILIVAILIGYFSLLFLLSLSTGLDSAWERLGVSPLDPRFADLRGVLAGFECTRLGYDAQLTNPCDPWNRPLAYPRLWLALVPFGLDQSHVIWGGFILAALFYFATFVVIGRVNYYAALIYSLILCSPSVMWIVERGNVDIVVFFLLFISLLIISKSRSLVYRCAGYALVLLAAFLKLFPIFGLSILLREKRKIFLILAVVFSAPFIIYWLSNLEELRAIATGVVSFTWRSFGFKVLPSYLIYYLFFVEGATVVLIFGTLIGLLSCLIGYKLFAKLLQQFKNWLNSNFTPDASPAHINTNQNLHGFRLGSSLYSGAFLMGSVFDYKLSFLLFAIPQMLDWIRSSQRLGAPSSIALIGILGTLYLSPSAFFNLDEVINWFLLGFFAYSFSLSLPEWFKSSVHDFGVRLSHHHISAQ